MTANKQTVTRYRLDAARSTFTVQAFAEGLFSFVGHDPTIAVTGFGGDVRFDPAALGESSLLMIVRADSLTVVGGASEKDRREIERVMHSDVLEAARHPEIVFMSTAVSARETGGGRFRALVTGDLTLHGVTRAQRIEAQVTLYEDRLRAQGEFSLRQSDFRVRPYSAVGGTLKVKDEVKLSFDIFAHA